MTSLLKKYIEPVTIGKVNEIVELLYSLPQEQRTVRSTEKRGERESNDFDANNAEKHTTDQIERIKQDRLLEELEMVSDWVRDARRKAYKGEF